MARYQVISEAVALEMYNDMLDQEGPVTVAGIQFDQSYALKELDPIAYDCGFNDYVSMLEEDEVRVEGYSDTETDEEE